MLESSTNMNTIKLPVRKDYYGINTWKSMGRTIAVVMTSITEEEENSIDHNEDLGITRGGVYFRVKPKNIYCYGEVDFSDGSDDLYTVDTFDWTDHCIEKGLPVYSNYDFKTHTCQSDLKRPRWHDSFSCAKVAQQAYAFIGKPKRIVIFKYNEPERRKKVS